jgi:uncharacterized protein (TIGR00369 family)
MAEVPEGYELFPVAGGFEAHVGPLYFRRLGGAVRLGFRVAEKHLNPRQTLHGGMMMTLIDDAIAMAVGMETASPAMATVSLSGDFLAAAKADEWVEAEGEVVRRTRELVFTRGTIVCGERTLFTASGVWKIFDSGGAAAPRGR